mgnify:CR=1 FL=1
MGFKTADLCDEHADRLQIAEPVFGDYGGEISFFGPITTLKAFEDKALSAQDRALAREKWLYEQLLDQFIRQRIRWSVFTNDCVRQKQPAFVEE